MSKHAEICMKRLLNKEIIGGCYVSIKHKKNFDKSQYFCEIQDKKLYIALNKNRKAIKSKGWEKFLDEFDNSKYGKTEKSTVFFNV